MDKKKLGWVFLALVVVVAWFVMRRPTDEERLTGKWVLAKPKEGEKVPERSLPLSMTFSSDLVTVHEGDNEMVLAWKCDPTASPKSIDFFGRQGSSRWLRGIYELDGKRLTICTPEVDSGERPASFELTHKTHKYVADQELVVLEKE